MKYDVFIHGAETLAKLILPKFSQDLLLAVILKVDGIEQPVEIEVTRPSGEVRMSHSTLHFGGDHDIEVQRVTLHEGAVIDGGDIGDLSAYPEVWTRDLCVMGAGEWEVSIVDILFLHWQKTGHDPRQVDLDFETVKSGSYRRSLKRTFRYVWKNGTPVLVGWINKKRISLTTDGTGSVLGDVSKYVLSSWNDPPEVVLVKSSCKNLPFGGWAD